MLSKLAPRESRGRVWPYVSALALVLLATAAAEGVYQLTNSNRLSSVFLTAVLITAFLFGAPPAYFAAAFAFLSYNLYLSEPRGSFHWESGDVVNLVVFFAVAMLTGNLTGRVREEASRAKARARATSALFEATREFSASDDEAFIRARFAHHLATAARGTAIVADGRGPDHISPAGSAIAYPAQPPTFSSQTPEGPVRTVDAGGVTLRPLYAGGVLVGVAGWTAPDGGPRADQRALLEILCDVGAAAIGRARLAEAKADAESLARTEDLRNALLSSISHDLRTPLTAIIASSSSLEQFGEKFDAATRRDLARTIQQSAERLNDFVANLLGMTKLESGVLSPKREPFSVREAVERTVQRRLMGQERKLTVSCEAALEAMADPVLFEQALGNVIENALRYTPAEAGVDVVCERSGDEVVVRVSDQGSGVSSAELVMLFVKFYRTSGAERLPGTGLGLSITKGLIEGMGGKVAASNRAPPETGLVVTMTLPVGDDG